MNHDGTSAQRPLCVALLFGGLSSEHEVSRVSACTFADNMDPEKYDLVKIGITKEGRWLYTEATTAQMADGSWEDLPGNMPCAISPDRSDHGAILFTPAGHVEKLYIDVVIPALHGLWGEDGTVQGLLELAGVPVVGCGTLASAMAMDKHRAHLLAAAAGVPCPRGAVFRRGAAPEDLAATAAALGYPLFCKPVRAGSSFGVTRVEGPEGLPVAAAVAFAHDDELLLEAAAAGHEVGCAVLGEPGGLTVGAVDWVELAGGFFDYHEKYTLETAALRCPAPLPPADTARVQAAARTVYEALGCRGFARVDFFLEADGRLLFNEVNTIPGLTAHSRFPTMMAAAGVGFRDLINGLVAREVGA